MSKLMEKQHNLKLLESFADDVITGYKTFEVRENDRGYQKGDTVKFTCVDKQYLKINHPINDKLYEITYVLNGWGIKNGFVVFGIKECEQNE